MTGSPIHEFLDSLRSTTGREPKPRGNGKWTAFCPAHNDRKAPSLSVTEGRDGRVLARCHKGCSFDDICRAIGKHPPEAFEKTTNPSTVTQLPKTAGNTQLCYRDHPNKVNQGQTMSKDDKKTPDQLRIADTYDYRDEQDELLYQVVRYEPKDFRRRRPKASGGWDWSLGDVRRVLYRLPEIRRADASWPVFITEGEKDANRLSSEGQIATCNAGGAEKWQKEFNGSLRHRHAVILPDNDDKGRKHAHQVASQLHGVAASVKIVELPELGPKGDASDWLDAGHTIDELLQIVEKTNEWEPEDDDMAYRPFPIDILPEPVRSFIKAGAKALGCDESLISLPLPAALAAAIGNTRRIMLKSSWPEPCIFWLAVVCDSGTLKSPAFDLALGSLREIESEAVRDYKRERKNYETRMTIYDVDLQRWKGQRRRNPNLPDPPPTPPIEPICDR